MSLHSLITRQLSRKATSLEAFNNSDEVISLTVKVLLTYN